MISDNPQIPYNISSATPKQQLCDTITVMVKSLRKKMIPILITNVAIHHVLE